MQIATLISKQNPDGGWPYAHGGSWTEPTVYAVMAMMAAGETGAVRRAMDWIRTHRLEDGGWPSKAGIGESSWATGLVALLPPETLGGDAHAGAIAWLLRTIGEESTFLYRVRQWMLGAETPPDQKSPGWPWTPGAAAWVGPTAIAVVALQKELQRRSFPEAKLRVDEGRNFLLNRMCQEGGWNHGAARALGYAAHAYPETTGMALMALRGVRSPKLEIGLAVAQRFLNESKSADAQNWLRLGLRVHGRLPEAYCPGIEVKYRTVPEIALNVICRAADEKRDWFGAGPDYGIQPG